MSKKRKTYSPSFRAKVALAAYRGDKTVHELAAQFQVSSQQITKWKTRLLDRIEEIFQDDRSRKKEDSPDESTLFEQIGRLKMEVDWLKKNQAKSIDRRRRLIDPNHPELSIVRQCELLDLNRSSYYFEPQGRMWASGISVHTHFDAVLPPNSPVCSDNSWSLVSASSYHPGGVSVATCDGAVRFVSETINCGNITQSIGAQNGVWSEEGHTGPSVFGIWGAAGYKIVQ